MNKRKNAVEDTLMIQTYQYEMDSLQITINVNQINSRQSNRMNEHSFQLTFDKDSENLIEINIPDENLIICYHYEHHNNIPSKIEYKYNKNEKLEYETILHSQLNEIKYNDIIYLNKIKSINTHKIDMETLLSMRFQSADPNKIDRRLNTLQYNRNHIYYSFKKRIQYDKIISENENGILLFDENQDLYLINDTETRETPTYGNSNSFFSSSYKKVKFHNKVKKKNTFKWIYYELNSDNEKQKEKRKGTFKIKKGNIYFNNNPVIIYN